eukprot:tig00000158_g10163.t1
MTASPAFDAASSHAVEYTPMAARGQDPTNLPSYERASSFGPWVSPAENAGRREGMARGGSAPHPAPAPGEPALPAGLNGTGTRAPARTYVGSVGQHPIIWNVDSAASSPRPALTHRTPLLALGGQKIQPTPPSSVAGNGGPPSSPPSSPPENGGAGGRRSADHGRFLDMTTTRAPITIQWKDLRYTITVGRGRKAEQKEILKGVKGCAKPGDIVAILVRPSGGGKTTLMNVIADRVASGVIRGTLLVNGKPVTKDFRRLCGYVMQDDLMFKTLTVRETLMLSAQLRLSRTMDHAEKKRHVDAVMDELGIRHVALELPRAQARANEVPRANTIIGGHGVRPTSGLDSFSALSLIETLDELARRATRSSSGRHPSPSHTSTAPGGAARRGGRLGYKCPQYVNPADYFLDIINVDRRTPEKEKSSRARSRPRSSLQAGFGTQLRLLAVRAWRDAIRNRAAIIARFAQTIVLAVLIGLIYLRVDPSHPKLSLTRTHPPNPTPARPPPPTHRPRRQTTRPRRAATHTPRPSPADYSQRAIQNRQGSVFLRERTGGWYRVSSYFLAKSAVDLPFIVFFPVLFCFISYWMVNLRAGFNYFLLFLAAVITTAVAGQARPPPRPRHTHPHPRPRPSVGLAVSAASPNVQAATAIGSTTTIILLLFGGFYANNDTIPVWLRWIQWLSFVKYGFAIVAINEFSGVQFSCEPSELVGVFVRPPKGKLKRE